MKKALKKLKNLTITEQIELIEEYYPGLKNLTNEEILMFGEIESLHDFQFYLARERFLKEKLEIYLESIDLSKDYADDSQIIGGNL